jgi:magnesium-transporting ATPase (P-type)
MLSTCSQFIDRDDSVCHITHEVVDALPVFTSDCSECLFLAYKEVCAIPQQWEEIGNDLTLLALIEIKDPLKDGVPAAV